MLFVTIFSWLTSTHPSTTSASLGMHTSAWCSWFITFDCNSFIVIERSLVRFWERRNRFFAPATAVPHSCAAHLEPSACADFLMEGGAWCGACSFEPRSEAQLLRIEEGPAKAHMVLLRSLSQGHTQRCGVGKLLLLRWPILYDRVYNIQSRLDRPAL